MEDIAEDEKQGFDNDYCVFGTEFFKRIIKVLEHELLL